MQLTSIHFPNVKLYEKRTIVLLWVILSNFLLFFGGTINPLTAGEQFKRRMQLPSLLDTKNPDIIAFNNDFDVFLQESEQLVQTRNKFSSQVEYEVTMLEIFIYLRIKHKPDLMQYLTVDHLPTVGEVLRSGVDDCDGRAILAATLLLHRGYEVWVLAHPSHYWVEIMVENGSYLHILAKKGIDTWYLRFNDREVVFSYVQTVGFLVYEWVLVLLVMGLIFFFHRTVYNSPFIRLSAKILAGVVVVTQLIYFGALGIVLLLYRIL